MKLPLHLLVSAILVFILFPFLGNYSYFALVGGFLIDLDHFFIYFFHFKNLNIKRAFKYFDEEYQLKNEFKDLYIFHCIEFLILGTFFVNNKIIYPILLGALIHMIMDRYEEIYLKMDVKSYSIILWIRRIMS